MKTDKILLACFVSIALAAYSFPPLALAVTDIEARFCAKVLKFNERSSFDLTLPAYCSPTPPPAPPPPPTPTPPPPAPTPTPPPPAPTPTPTPTPPPPTPAAPTLTFTANPQNVFETATTSSASTTLTWVSTNASLCVASNGWAGIKALSGAQSVTLTATTTYTLSCGGAGGTTTESVTVNYTQFNAQILISEVYYDVASTTGQEPANEWLELFNPGPSAVNLARFTISDGVATDTIPAIAIGQTLIQPGGYLIVTASSTTSGFWNPTASTTFVVLTSSIGNGLANGGDALFLRASSGVLMDSVSWGTNTSAFDPSVPGVAEGHSIARTEEGLENDTGTAADWEDLAIPTPGL